MRRHIYADSYVLPRKDTMTVVPTGSRGMKDDNPEVRAATSRAMLAERYAHTPKFTAKCAYPPCPLMIEGYDRNGKRRKFCSPTHNTADCRRRQRERGLRRVTIDGVVRLMHVDEIPPMINRQPVPGWPVPLPPPVRRERRSRPPRSRPTIVQSETARAPRTWTRPPRSWRPVRDVVGAR
jgi:hypothetical protein